MRTFLLAWNPTKFPHGGLRDELAQVRREGSAADIWSVTATRQIRVGDRVFLIRLGGEPRGIVGSGWVEMEPFRRLHWIPERASRGDTVGFVGLRFDQLGEEPLIPWAVLRRPPLADFTWGSQNSGVRIPDSVAAHLEREWERVHGGRKHGPEEFIAPGGLWEGGLSRVYVNRYERSRDARDECLREHGHRCSICGISFAEVYGPAAAGIIHVHHLRPLSAVGASYQVDPVQDLRPVCPNCHAVIHSRAEPYSIEELRRMMGRTG